MPIKDDTNQLMVNLDTRKTYHIRLRVKEKKSEIANRVSKTANWQKRI